MSQRSKRASLAPKSMTTIAAETAAAAATLAIVMARFALQFASFSGTGAKRRVEGVWHRKDASTTLRRQIVAVAGL